MAEATIDDAMHSAIAGKAHPNLKLTVSKSSISATSPVIDAQGNEGDQRYFKDTLTSSYDTEGGNFRWAVNPSTRPLVVGRYGREKQADPQPQQAVTNPAGTPAKGAYEETTFTVGGLPQDDNGTATVVIGWPDNTLTTTPPTPPIDWDVDTPSSYSGLEEAWNLTCSERNGKVVSTQEVVEASVSKPLAHPRNSGLVTRHRRVE
jgi:hypothetical protein